MKDYAEMWRPQYHYSTLDSSVNDPNGLVYYKGVYHLYYQTWPHQPVRGCNLRDGVLFGVHWGHAVSTDLIHWKEQEEALFPDDLGHMWSGTAVVDYDNTSGFFTDTEEKQGIVVAYSTNTQHIGIAYSTDDGKTFTKVSKTTPVISNPCIRCFRDPHIFWHPETKKWKMVVAGHSGIIWIYEADDLVHWKLCSRNGSFTTECPNLIRMTVEGSTEEKWVFICCGREYYVGTFDGYRFKAETDRMPLNEGPDAYAGITFSNMPDGRTVMISWLFGLQDCAEGKWNGGHTVPVEMKLVRVGTSYRIMQSPVRELSSVKGENLLTLRNKSYSGKVNPLDGVRSNCFELNAEIDLSGSEVFSISVCEGEGEETVISYDKMSGCMSVDKRKSKYGRNKTKNSLYNFHIDPTSIKENILKIRLLVDISAIELFVNDGYYYFVMRIQPCTTSQNMSIRYDGSLFIHNLTVDKCNSIWFQNWDEVAAMHAVDNGSPNYAEEGSGDDDITDSNIRDEIDVVYTPWYWNNKTFEYGGKDYFQKMRSGQAREVILDVDDFSLPVDVELHGEGIAEILFRMTDISNFYCISMDVSSDKILLWKKVDGVAAEICVSKQTLFVNKLYHFRIEAMGSALKVYFEGDCIFDVNDDTFAAGQIAVNVYISDVEFEFGKIGELKK